jgi:hypothetical protein
MSQRTGYSRNISDSDDEEDTQQPLAISPKKTPKSTKRAAESHSETPRPKRGKIAKRNTLLWEYFEYTENLDVVRCTANASCLALIKRPQGSTSGMTAHLEKRHPVQYLAYVAKKEQALKDKVSKLKILNAFHVKVFEFTRNSL